MSKRRLRRQASSLLVLVLGLGFALTSAHAQGMEKDAAVGSDGVLYLVREGTYGALFPGQGLANPEDSALAVDLVRPDQTRERLLVPGTETAHSEDSSSLLFEDQSDTLFVLWQTKINVIHSRLNLIALRDGEWSEPIEISGSPFGWKSAPQLAVTRDSFRTLESDGSVRRWTRTVVHLLWWEDGASGEPQAHYSPVTLLDGVYTGWNPVYSLDELAFSESIPASPNLELAQAPRIEPGRNGQSVVIAFVLPGRGQLVTAAIEVLPGELSFIADRIRNQIIDVGRALMPDQPTALAGKVRNQIIDVGGRLGLHPSVPAYAAHQAVSEILSSPPEQGLDSLAERVRNQIIDVGARVDDRGLDRASAAQRLEILETSNGAETDAPANLFRVVEVSARPVPPTGELDNALFLSRNGREVVVSWIADAVVFYRESRGQGWSEARPLRLGNELDLRHAREILERRADERSDE